MRRRIRAALLALVMAASATLLAAAGPAELLGAVQRAVDPGSQTLGRGYWHVFVAYALAWVSILAWAVSIGRRLAEVERRLGE